MFYVYEEKMLYLDKQINPYKKKIRKRELLNLRKLE